MERALNESVGKSFNKSAGAARVVILDYIRALLMIRIFLYHYYVEWFGASYFFVMDGPAANVGRMWVFDGGVSGNGGAIDGFWSLAGWILAVFMNVFSWFFMYGFATVNVFLLISGFVLTLSMLNRGDGAGAGQAISKIHGIWLAVRKWVLFNWKRLRRLIVPFYIAVLAGILFWYGRNLFFPQFADWPLFDLWDLGKLLVLPFLFFDMGLLQRFNGDYWFIVLILQLYLLFPVLYWVLKKVGVWKFMFFVAVLTFGYRYYAAFYLDGAPSGVLLPTEHSYRIYSFFLPRLFEFSFGMALGWLYFSNNKIFESFKKARWFWMGTAATLGGYFLLMYRWGWIFSDAVLGVGLFFLFFGIANWISGYGKITNYLKKIGESAYELYLWHHYFLNYFLMYLLFVLGLKGNEWVFFAVMPVYFVIVVYLGFFGKYLTGVAERAFARLRGR